MHDAICDECGKNCQVPFRPTGDKPIYCSDCFEKKGGRGSGSRPRREDRPRADNNLDVVRLSKNIESLNGKLDVIISLLKVEKKESQPEAKVASKSKAKPKKAKKSSKKKK